MTSEGETSDKQLVDQPMCPAVAMYGPTNVLGLKEGELKKWCTCGLSKTQPWCDGSHKNTGFRSLKWTVPTTQTRHEICNCKHTKSPPYCDGTHTNLPEIVLGRQKNCCRKEGHKSDCKLCTGCGWVPDF